MRLWLKRAGYGAAAVMAVFVMATAVAVAPVQSSLHALRSDAQTLQVTARDGRPLTISYQNRWNVYDNLPIYAIPDFIQQAFVVSEDKRFFDHSGVDWQARGSALLQDWKQGHVVRGASTITEQVARMINPRSRNLWSKWVEGWEATLLEAEYSKSEILEFYLNQVPYAANRRGIAQAARYYFDRDVSTLNTREMLALPVLARAPSSYDLYKDSDKISGLIDRLAEALQKKGVLTAEDIAQLKDQPFDLAHPAAPVNAEHFAAYLRTHNSGGGNSLHSTLDADLQARVQRILDDRVRTLNKRNLHNGAALVVDYTTGDVLAWAVAGAGNPNAPGSAIDAVTVPRQPGSAQKPLLYGLALDSGWTPATIIDDAPLSEAIGSGLHNFKNYSNLYYGHVTVREALANSLNIPALLTIKHVGTPRYLDALHRMGFQSLDRGAEIYDEGLALGNGEVTLLEMVQGFSALANHGVLRPLRFLSDDDAPRLSTRVYSEESASLIGNILSDAWARRLEFGNNSVLNLPVQTAAKTGTSTDYRDAWVMGYNHRYLVGIWMGNLDRRPMDGVTGSTGPALALRSIFNELNRNTPSKPLWLSPKLVQKDICIEDAHTAARCYMRSEFFAKDSVPDDVATEDAAQRFEITRPTDGLQMAVDPRIPQDFQKVPFTLSGLQPQQSVEWILNGKMIAESGRKYLWPLARGHYTLQARVKEDGKTVHTTPEIAYLVK